jgi:hypothetical protein
MNKRNPSITMWPYMVAMLIIVALALFAFATRSEAGPVQQEVTIRVERSFSNGGCEEDEVLRGRGDYSDGMYQRYACWNPGW